MIAVRIKRLISLSRSRRRAGKRKSSTRHLLGARSAAIDSLNSPSAQHVRRWSRCEGGLYRRDHAWIRARAAPENGPKELLTLLRTARWWPTTAPGGGANMGHRPTLARIWLRRVFRLRDSPRQLCETRTNAAQILLDCRTSKP